MASSLLLAVSQEENDVFYQFKMTNVKVFSFEEALYHVYHNWKQTVDDFCCDEFIRWTNNALRLSFIASKIKTIAETESFSERLH